MAKILVVDDSPGLLAEIGKILRDEGHEVTSTNSGLDALCLLKEQKYELLVLDLMMPGVDGFKVLENMNGAITPVLVITGIDVEDVTIAKEGRMVRILAKPFDATDLLTKVREILGDNQCLQSSLSS